MIFVCILDLSSFSMALEVGSLNVKDEINRLRCPGFAARFLYDLGEKPLTGTLIVVNK